MIFVLHHLDELVFCNIYINWNFSEHGNLSFLLISQYLSSSFWKNSLRVPLHLFPNYMRMCGPHMKKQRTAFPRFRSCHFKHTLTAYMVTPYWPQCARWCVCVCVCVYETRVGGT